MFYSFIEYGFLTWQFTSKPKLNRVFILQKKCLPIIKFSFYKSHSNPLFKDLKLLKLHDVFQWEIITFFYKFSRNELPKSVCSQFNLVHEFHTRNALNSLLIYISIMSTTQYGNHFVHHNGASLWNKFFIFQNMIWLPSLNRTQFLWNDFYKVTEMSCKLLAHIQTISSQFSYLNVLLWNVVQLLNYSFV